MGIKAKQDLYTRDTAHLTFRKAQASNTGNGCVGVAIDPSDGAVFLRDEQNPHLAPRAFTAYEWSCFLDGVKNGEFDL